MLAVYFTTTSNLIQEKSVRIYGHLFLEPERTCTTIQEIARLDNTSNAIDFPLQCVSSNQSVLHIFALWHLAHQ
jgi:hypothetical protein